MSRVVAVAASVLMVGCGSGGPVDVDDDGRLTGDSAVMFVIDGVRCVAWDGPSYAGGLSCDWSTP